MPKLSQFPPVSPAQGTDLVAGLRGTPPNVQDVLLSANDIAALAAPPTPASDVTITSPDSTLDVSGSPGSDFAITVASGFLGALNVLPGVYTYATLPAASSQPRKFAATTDQGGVYSNGVYWQILYNITVGSLAISSNSPLTPATQSAAYSNTLTATAGVAPYTWTLISKFGAANAWALSSGGVLTGTPGTITTDVLAVQVSDATGAVAQKLLTLQTVASVTPAATPTFSPVAGTYTGTQTVAISCSTPSSTIYYTTNGSTPTTGSTVYSAPISVAVSETVQAIATAAGFTQSAVGSAAYTILHPLGNNLTDNLAYYGTEQPFLNLVKSGGQAAGLYSGLGWIAGTGIGSSTNYAISGITNAASAVVTITSGLGANPLIVGEVINITGVVGMTQINNLIGKISAVGGSAGAWTATININSSGFSAYSSGGTVTNVDGPALTLDSDGYPVQIPQAGLATSNVYCYICWGIATPPTAPTAYPPGVYRIQWTGTGSITIDGADASAGSGTGGSGLTFTNAGTGVFSGTFTSSGLCSGGTGIRLTITSSNPSNNGNQIRGLSIVLNSLAASFDGGAIFHPNFLASVANLSTLRFKDWIKTDTGEFHRTNALSGILLGNTNLVLGFNWNEASGTYPVLFDDGQLINGTFTFGLATVTLASGVTKAISAGQLLHCVTFRRSYATRSLTTWAFYTTGYGVPYETCISLSNTNNSHAWVNPPLTASDAYHNSMAALFHTNLASNLFCYPQLTNEMWNSGFNQYAAGYSLGNGAFAAGLGSQNDYQLNYNGMRSAVMSELWKAVWGADFGRCFPLYGGAVGNTYSTTQGMDTPMWTGTIDGYNGPASAHSSLKCVAIAPYFPIQGGIPSQADANKMLAQADGGLDYFFQTMYSNIITGGTLPGTFASIPTNGMQGQTLHGGGGFSGIDGHVTMMASKYPTMKLIAYEGGNQIDGGNPSGTTPGIYTWQQLCNAANRDARMATAYANYLNYWATNVGPTQANINVTFNHCDSYSRFSWGAIESVMQTLSPLSSAPQRYQAEHTYIGA